MIVEVTEDVPLRDQFCWLTVGQIGELLRRDNVVNMDSRSIFSCIPTARSWIHALHPDTDLLSWFTAVRSRPLFADLVRDAPPSRVRYDAVLAEEGGRFLNAESRYRIVEIDETEVPSPPPPDYQWVTPGQLSSLVRHGHYVNVQARSLLAAFTTGAVDF